jgi:hypothetical protein
VLTCFYNTHLVEKNMCHAVSRVDCDHTVKVGLGFFEKTVRGFAVFPTVRILGHVKADRSSVDVEDGIVLVGK